MTNIDRASVEGIASIPYARPERPDRVDVEFDVDAGARLRVRQYFSGEPIPKGPDDLLIPCGSGFALVRIVGRPVG